MTSKVLCALVLAGAFKMTSRGGSDDGDETSSSDTFPTATTTTFGEGRAAPTTVDGAGEPSTTAAPDGRLETAPTCSGLAAPDPAAVLICTINSGPNSHAAKAQRLDILVS